VRRWLKDRHFRLLLKNSSYLTAAQIVSAIAGTATVAFAGRALGVQLFGMLVLISSYAALISSISKFQAWQMIVRYGGKALAADAPQEFKAAAGFALGLDAATGVVGMIAGMLLVPWLGPLFGISHGYLGVAMLYCTLIPTIASATPEGTLRTLNRFDLLAWQGSIYAIVRGALAGLLWAIHASFDAFVLLWWATSLGGDLWLWLLTWRELRARDLLRGIRPTLRPKTLAGAWRFAIHTNLYTTLLSGGRMITPLIIGGVMGPSAAGLYRIASRAANALRKPADLLMKVYYPQISGMDFATKTPWRLMARVVALACAFGVFATALLLLGGKPIISLIFGKHFLPSYEPLLVLSVGSLLGMLSFPLAPMLYSLDRPEAPVKARLIGTGAQLILMIPFMAAFGLVGAAAASVIGYAVGMVAMMLSLQQEYHRVRQPAISR
jgi:O-antigen/teichoic acid export membrane protein